MSKTIIINENILKKASSLLKENVLIDELPSDIKDALKKNNTSLGVNPAFPEEYGDTFDSKIIAKRFNEVKEKLIKIGEIEEADDISTALSKLIKKCQELEAPIKENLEKIAYNYIISLFDLPEDTIELSIALTEEIGDMQMGVRVKSEDSHFDFDTVKHKKSLNDEINKRRLLNAIMTGGAMRISSNIKSYIADIYDLEPKLPDLYRKILALNDYLLFTNNEEMVSDNNKNQLGLSNIIIGNQQTKSVVKIEAVIFPILIYEEVRAFLELAAAHGLPSSKSEANYVMTKADYLQAEPWDMRFGPALWDYIMTNNDIENNLIPYVFMKLSKLPIKKFNFLMQELFSETKKGRRIMEIILNNIQKDCEYDEFTNRLQMKNADISMINDEYIRIEEL